MDAILSPAGDRVSSVERSIPRWRQPVVTVAGMAATVALVAKFDRRGAALVLGAVLALTLSRSHLMSGWRGRLEALLILPLVALATGGVGFLLKSAPLIGAASFAAAMFLSIWLRRFGTTWTRIGSLLALPFITLLITPASAASLSTRAALALPVAALVIVTVIRVCAEYTGFLPKEDEAPAVRSPPTASSLQPIPSTRMALQLMTAILAAFLIGWRVFPGHVTWVVLTAFLVCSGNRGRVDVLYKSGLRIVGAAGGTLLAAGMIAVLPAGHAPVGGPGGTVLLLLIVGIGLWLREWTYAAWAFAMSLVVALLRSGMVEPEALQIWERVVAIVAGAACGLAASWLLLPIRSEPVVRKRIADTLADLGEFLVSRDDLHRRQLRAALARVNEVSPPWDAVERFAGRFEGRPRPGRWIALTRACVEVAQQEAAASPAVRRTLGEARRAMREPDAIEPALAALLAGLSGKPA